jgi:hypothetical protein
MLEKAMRDRVAAFDQAQELIFAALGDGVLDLLQKISQSPLNQGKAPFVLELDGDALFVAEGSGKLLRLPPDFQLTDEMLSESPEAIYSLPFGELGLVRFLSIDADVELPAPYSGGATVAEITPGFLASLDQLLAAMHSSALELASAQMAKSLVRVDSAMREAAADSGQSVAELLASQETMEVFVDMLGRAYAAAAERSSEILLDAFRERERS